MGRIHYSVVAVLPDVITHDRYLTWLREGHLQGVLDGGAVSAEILTLDASEIRIQTSYCFSDRDAFDRYEREFAPALRADGLKRFGATPGVRFERSVGEEITEG